MIINYDVAQFIYPLCVVKVMPIRYTFTVKCVLFVKHAGWSLWQKDVRRTSFSLHTSTRCVCLNCPKIVSVDTTRSDVYTTYAALVIVYNYCTIMHGPVRRNKTKIFKIT